MSTKPDVLAIDPGNDASAYVTYDAGRITGFAKIPNAALLRDLPALACERVVAIEMIASYGMAVGREVFETCLWIGRYLERLDGRATLVYRRDVKLHICHTVKANDASIRTELMDRLGKPGTKREQGITYGIKKDVWAALALAVMVSDQIATGHFNAVPPVIANQPPSVELPT